MNYLPAHHIDFACKFAARLRLTAVVVACMIALATLAGATEVDLAISEVAAMNFGTIIAGQTGTVTLTASSGSCVRTANPTSLILSSSPFSCGHFTVRDPSEKDPNHTNSYTYTPASSSTVACNGGSVTASFSGSNIYPYPVSYTGATYINSSTGLTGQLSVGATMTISSSLLTSGQCLPGSYSGFRVDFFN